MSQILGVSCRTPPYSVDQETASGVASTLCCSSREQARLLKVLYRRTKIRRRASVLLTATEGRPTHDFYYIPSADGDPGPGTRSRMEQYERHAGLLASDASRAAIEAAGIAPADVSHLITVSCTGFHAPGVDYTIFRTCELAPSIDRIHIGFMGCHAALNALKVASDIVSARASARILICAVELCSLHFQYGWDPDQIVSNSLFADGAGALVVGSDESKKETTWRHRGGGSYIFPDSADAMTWRIGEHGFLMTLSSRVPDLIQHELAAWVDQWLGQFELTRSDIASWAIHPGGPRILRYAERALDLTRTATETSHDVLAAFGNMSSPTLIFILERLMQAEAPRPCVALGFGPGLTVEAALFE